jgi:hypothetical protein
MTIKSIRTGWTGISALAGNDQWFSDFESIASVTVGTNAPEDIIFSSIPSTYQHLQIRAIMKSTTSAMQVAGNFNNATPTSWWHELYGDGSTCGSVANSGSYLGFTYCTQNDFSAMIVDILDYANTNKNKTVRSFSGYDANGSGYVFFRSALWSTNTNAISEIKISKTGTNGFAQHSHFALYGIRG